MTDQRKSLTRAEAAKYLGVHVNTIDRWKKKRKLEYVLTPGGIARFPIEGLERFLDDRRRKADDRAEVDEAVVRAREGLHELRRSRDLIMERIQIIEGCLAEVRQEFQRLDRHFGKTKKEI